MCWPMLKPQNELELIGPVHNACCTSVAHFLKVAVLKACCACSLSLQTSTNNNGGNT